MVWRVEICNKPGIFDAVGEGIKKDVEDLGYKSVKRIKTVLVYLVEGNINETAADMIAGQLLTDKVTQDYSLNCPVLPDYEKISHGVEVAHNPGVMDPVEESTLKGIRDMGVRGVKAVSTASRFLIEAKLAKRDIDIIAEKLLYNKVIQHVTRDTEKMRGVKEVDGYKFDLVHVDIMNADDKKLAKISKDGQLFLNLDEMQAIKRYFSKIDR